MPCTGGSALETFFEETVLDAGIDVTFLDATVSFDRRLLIATGRLTVSIKANEKNYGIQTCDVVLRQIEGNWLVTGFRIVVPTEQ